MYSKVVYRFFLFVFLFFIFFGVMAQRHQDVLYLKDGSVLRGQLTDCDTVVRLLTPCESLWVFSGEEVLRVEYDVSRRFEESRAGMTMLMELGVMGGKRAFEDKIPLDVQVLCGYRFNSRFSVAGGSGIVTTGVPVVPFIAYGKWNILKTPISPYLYAQGAFTLPFGSYSTDNFYYGEQEKYRYGYLLNTGLGLERRISSSSSFIFSMGFWHERLFSEYEEYVWYGGSEGSLTVDRVYEFNRFVVRFGWQFN